MPKKRAKTIHITDQHAIKLINNRAEREHRTAANAAAITIYEQLGDTAPQGQKQNGTAIVGQNQW